MTLNGVMAVILRYFSEFAYLPGVLRKSSRSLSHLLMSSCTQCTPEPTRSGNLLDLVLVSDPLAVSDITVAPPFSTSDHNLVDVSFLYTMSTLASGYNVRKSSKRFKWEQGDYDSVFLFSSVQLE